VPEHHRFLKFILPAKAFEAVKAGTKEWLIECRSSGYKRDIWDEGGTRYKAKGEPVSLGKCSKCDKKTWQKARKKSDEEKQQL